MHNIATVRSGLSLPYSHASFQYSRGALEPKFFHKNKGLLMNDWKEAEWFVEWLKLARKEGN